MKFLHFFGVICFILIINAVESQYKEKAPRVNDCVKEWQWDGWGDDREWCCGVSYTCCGARQSPINIEKSPKLGWVESNKCAVFSGYETIPKRLTLNNNKYTIQMLHRGKAQIEIEDQVYKFDRATFHFGETSANGSMHTIYHQQFPMEMQLVHYNQNYGSLETATYFEDGILTVSVLFMSAFHDNNDLRPLIYDLHYVMWKDDTRCIKPFPMMNLLPHNYITYYEYQGSLPFPPCTQNVRWIVLHHPQYISEYQLGQFRKMQRKTQQECPDRKCPMWNNFRRPVCYDYNKTDIYGNPYMDFYGKKLYARQMYYKKSCYVERKGNVLNNIGQLIPPIEYIPSQRLKPKKKGENGKKYKIHKLMLKHFKKLLIKIFTAIKNKILP